MTALLLTGVALIAAAMPLSGVRSPLPALGAQIAGALVVAAAAVTILVTGDAVGAAFHSAVDPRLGVDPLSACFIAVVALAAVPASLVARDLLSDSPVRRALLGLTAAFILSLLGVLAARDVTTFLAFWELMTLVPATAILVARRDAEVRRTVFVYLAITHVGGAGVWVALLTLANHGALDPGATVAIPQTLVLVAALVGFGTKAGIMPLHVWLPRAHPVAPSHISALMSAVMLKVAIYGLIRVLFEWAGPAPRWVGLVLLGAGVLSAVAGVLYALVQRELKRLLAFSSVENVGIIAAALGASIVLFADGEDVWGTIAFGAALLHTINHAAFKALLFLGAGAFGHAAGGLELDRLGGLLRRMPWTAGSFLVGCAAIAGLPLLNGFASEWLALQSVLHVGYGAAPGIAVAGALATAGLACAAALAGFCFVKVVGLALLGMPRSEGAADAHDPSPASRIGLAVLAGACLALGVLPGLVLPTLAELAPGDVEIGAGTELALPGTGTFAPLALLVGAALVFAVVLRATRSRRAAPTPAWTCGQPVEPALAWTPAGFSKPLQLVLENVLRPRRELEVVERVGGVDRLSYHAEVSQPFDELLYLPIQRRALAAAAVVRRLQSGSLRTYVLYLLGLVLVLLALLRLGGLS